MAFLKGGCAVALLLLLLLAFDRAQGLQSPGGSSFSVVDLNSVEDDAPNSSGPQIDCAAACSERCQLSSRPNLCHRACGTCCERCNCVPPGTSGNYDVCPCYASMTTHGGRHKCP